jgi:hypothetical protein
VVATGRAEWAAICHRTDHPSGAIIMRRVHWFLPVLLAALTTTAWSQETEPKAKAPKKAAAKKAVQPAIEPTKADVAYGPHPKQVLHFWQAK